MRYEYDTGILLRTAPYGIVFLNMTLFLEAYFYKRKEGISNAYNNTRKYRKNISKKAGD